MNLALFNAMLKTRGKSLFSFAIGALIYEWLIIWIWPSFKNAGNLEEVMSMFPEEVLKAFGFEKGGFDNLSSFLSTEFYGFLFVVILIIYSIMTAIHLIARFVDQGSMAYLLATPVSRAKVAVTQATFLLFGLFLICLFTTFGGWAGAQLLIDDPAFDVAPFIQINLLGFLLFSVIGGYSFLISCLFNDEKRALGAAAGLTLLFYAMDMIGKLSEDLGWVRDLSIFSLFRPTEIAMGTYDVLPTALGLGLATLVLLAAAVQIFRKRDLPL